MANNETRELANLAEVFKALGHPTRLWIAKNLEGKELCVCDFVNGTGEEFSRQRNRRGVFVDQPASECPEKSACRGVRQARQTRFLPSCVSVHSLDGPFHGSA